MDKAGRVLAFALFGVLLLLNSGLDRERTLDRIVLFNGDVTDLAGVESTGAVVLEKFHVINGAHIHATGRQLAAIEKLPYVEGVYPNRVLRPMLAESVPLIGASIAQAQGYTGSGIKVAIVDTGINVTDGRISGRVINQSDCTQSSCLNKNPVVNQDSSGHGTQMAIIAAGSSGVATAASVMDVKVESIVGGAFESDVVKGIEYALSPDGYASTNDGADVILLSFGVDIGGSVCAGPASAAIDKAVSKGVSVIVANGDTGCINGTMYPACARKAIAVGSTTDAASTAPLNCPTGCGVGGTSSPNVDSWFCGSSRGVDKWEGKIKPDLVAPGYAIDISSQPYGGSPQYGTLDSSYIITHSSSIAAAHVAGASAILMQKIKANWGGLKDPNPDTANVNSSTAALKAILLNSANELGAAGRDETYGAGRLNVSEGLQEANSTYVQYCNRWDSIVGDVSTSVKLYHNISVPSGAANLSVTLYWEENNKTTHKNLGLTLKSPSLQSLFEESPAADVVRQRRVNMPANGIWYAVVQNVYQIASKYVIVSNYPIGDCQPPTLTTVSIRTYNGTVGAPHSVRDDFFPSNYYDWLEEYNYGTQVVQYSIDMYDQFGQVFDHGPGTTLSISYKNGSSNGEVNFDPGTTPTGTGSYSTLISNTNYIPLPPDAAATYTGGDWPQHRWYLNALVSGCGLGCPKSAAQKEFYVNKTYGQQLSIGGASSTTYNDATLKFNKADITINVSNLGNVGDRYTIRTGDNFTANAAGIWTSGRCTFNLVTNPVSADYKGVGSTSIEVGPADTLTGGDYCWMDYVNATSENALFLVKNTTQDNGWMRKVDTIPSPLCDGLPFNYSAGKVYAYFTYTPMEGDVYVKETDLAIRAYPDAATWKQGDGKINFEFYYAKDDDGDFVPNNGEAYQLAFSRNPTAPGDDTLSQIEVNSTQLNMPVGPLLQFQQSSLGYKRFLLRQGQKYSFKVKILDADLFQLGVTQRTGETATGGCTSNVVDNNSAPPSGCLCSVGSAFPSGTVVARFFGHEAKYGFSQVSGVGLYINDTISFLEDINYKSQVCEGDLGSESYCRPKFGNLPIYRNSTRLYFRASPKTHNLPNNMVQSSNIVKSAGVTVLLYDGNGTLVNSVPYSVPCSTIPCKSASTIPMPHYNYLGQVAKVGVWSANFSASAQYFTPASQVTTFTVRGVTNISITNAQNKYYRGANYTFNSTVRNEFWDVEDPAYYGVVWELHNSTGSRLINSSKDFRYAFPDEVGLVNISANASGTYLDASNGTIAAEIWDRLNSSVTIVPDQDYQLGSYLNFSINVTRSFGEPVVSGIDVRCNVTAANRGNGTNLIASFSGGLWACRQLLDKDTTFVGSSQIRAYANGSYYEPNVSARTFTILGANLSIMATAPSYAYMGSNFTFRFNVTNRGNWNGSNVHFSLLLPAGLVRASGNWSERDLNDTEALGHNIRVGESFNYSWLINTSSSLGNYTVNISITADNAPAALVVSQVEVRSTMDLSVPNPVRSSATVRTNVSANVTNVGVFNVTSVNVSIILPADVQLTGGNQSYLFNLAVGAKRSLTWEVLTDLGGNFTLFFNVTSDNGGFLLRNATFSAVNRLKVEIVSPKAPKVNVTDYLNFTAIVNVTHNRSVVADLLQQNFSALVGPYPAAIMNASFQDSLWNLTIAAPQELNESLNYDLRIRVLYFNISINASYDISSVSPGAVHSLEAAPVILNVSMPSSFSVGNASRFNVSVYDKSALAYLSGTFHDSDGNAREYNFSLVSASGYYKNYTYLFIPAVEGEYNLTLNAMDWYGTNSTNATNFSVYGPPRIRNLFFQNSRYLILGENVTLVVNATSHVSQITVRVNISNGTSPVTFNATPTSLGYNLTWNFTGIGTYYVRAFANDSYGNLVAYNDSFTVSTPVGLSGNFSLDGMVSLNPVGTADPRMSVNGNFSAVIPAGTYDIYARTSDGNLTVKLNSVQLSSAYTGRVISIAPAAINSSVFQSRLAYDVTTNFTYPDILVGIKYSPSYNSSRVYVYKCGSPAWNNSICNGNWSRLGTSVDVNATTAYATVTSLSAFSVGQEHVLSSKLLSISPNTGVTPGTAVNVTFNVSLDGNPQETKITPRVWFDYAELNTSGHVAGGYMHNLTATAPPVTALTRSVILEAGYREPGAADYITATDTLVGGVLYYIAPACGDGLCNGNESCATCSADCGCGGNPPGGGGGPYTLPVITNYTPPQPGLLILEYPAPLSIAAGGSASRNVSVKNVGNIALNVSMKFDELTLWITSPGSKKIAQNASAMFEIYYDIPAYAQAGIYPYSLKAIANNFYNTTLAIKSSQLTVTEAAPAANATPPANATPYTPPTAESRYSELKDRYEKTKNDLKKIEVLGYNVSSLNRDLGRAGSLLDDAGAAIKSSQAAEKLDLASAKLESVRESARGLVSAKYESLLSEKPEYADVLSQADAALGAGDFGKAAYLLDSIGKKSAAGTTPAGTSIVYSIILIVVLLAIGGAGYYKKEEIKGMVDDMTHVGIPLQVEDLYSKSRALLGKRVSIKGTVIASGAREGGFWIKVRDRTGEALVWNREDRSLGELIEVRGIVAYDRSIDLWYVDARVVKGASTRA